MKKIVYYFSLLMMLIALASCQNTGTYYDVSYYINYKLVAVEQVKENENITLSIDSINTDEENKTIRNYVASLLGKNDKFDYWYTDISYETKVTTPFAVTGKVSLYGRIVKPSDDNIDTPDPTPTPDPKPEPEIAKLSTPVVTINESGKAVWAKVVNATRYKYQITGQNEKTTNDTSIQLQDGQTIKVKALGDGINYSDSDYSTSQTYIAPIKPDPTPDPKPEPSIPGDLDGNGTIDSVEQYYLSAYNLTGDALKKELHQITEKTHTKHLTYKECWDAIGKADKGSKPNTVICVYTGVEFNVSHRDGGSSGASVVWNREHVWPNSKGFGNQSYTAYSDVHHLFASEKNINATRGNKDFGEVSSSSSKDAYGNSWNSSYFEPRDEVKGNLARALFYMLVRYDGDTCGNCTLDLELVVGSSSSKSNSEGKNGYLGDLAMLIKWHYEDPVDETDIARNEAVYGIQGNRNPFIDYPEYIALLYPDLAASYI